LEAKANCNARNFVGEGLTFSFVLVKNLQGVLNWASDSLIPILQAAGAVDDEA